MKCVSGEGPETVLEGFTITGGYGTGKHGGGMHNEGSSPLVTGSSAFEPEPLPVRWRDEQLRQQPDGEKLHL